MFRFRDPPNACFVCVGEPLLRGTLNFTCRLRIFRDTWAGVTGATIELCDTDGSVGAARGAGIGAGIYADNKEAFASLKKLQVIEPVAKDQPAYREAYERWLTFLP